MSDRCFQARPLLIIVTLFALFVPVMPAAAQLPPDQTQQPATPAQPAAANRSSFNLRMLPTPTRGQEYRLSLCDGTMPGPKALSKRCMPSKAKTVSGTANHEIFFRLANGSFLPPGLGLDGNGIIHGTTTADLMGKSVVICAFQLNTEPGCNTVHFGNKLMIDEPKKKNAKNEPKSDPSKGGPSAGKIIGGIIGAAGAGVGALIAIDYAKKAIDESNAATAAGGSTSGGGTTSTANRFDGTYRAVTTNSCTNGPTGPSGVAVPCASLLQAVCAVSNGAPSPFIFAVRNGVISDACSWIYSASVSSSGVFVGQFNGTGANSMTLRGNFVPSGAFPLSGSGLDTAGNTYRSTLQVTKQ
jgi:hypothetical protein